MKNLKKRWLVGTEVPNNRQSNIIQNLSGSSLSSSEDQQSRHSAKDSSVGSKRVRDSVFSSSTSPSSTLSPPFSDDGHVQKLINSKISLQAPQHSKLINFRTTQTRRNKPSKKHNSIFPEGLTKARPSKRVRFAMDVQASDIRTGEVDGASSSHSSDDSYTDPPSPTEPYDAFGGYYRTSSASRSRGMNEQNTGWRMRVPAGVGSCIDGYDSFLDSEDGSEVDVQGLPVKGRHTRTVQAAAKGLTPDQPHQQSNSTSHARSKHPQRVIASGLEGNVDSGPHLEESHLSQKGLVSSFPLSKQLRYPKLRSGKNLPEPIFVIRPRFLSDAEEKGKAADMLRCSGYSRGMSKNGHERTKTLPSHPTKVRALRRNKSSRYHSPSVSDDLKKNADLDEDLGMQIRDVPSLG